MRSYRCAVLLAAVLSVMSLGVGDAAAPPKMEKVIVKETVKPYRALSSAVVYSLAGDKDRVEVQFEDVFASRLKRGDGPKSVKIDGVRYEPVLVLRGRSRVICLVDATRQPLLRQLLGLPARWPLSKEALRREVIFKEGQKIAVRGTTVGMHDGKRCVLVHALSAEVEKPAAVLREVQVLWPGLKEPVAMSKTGTQKFACRYVKDKEAKVEVSIRPMSRAELLADTALRLGKLEVAPGKPAEPRKYVQFATADVRVQTRDEQSLDRPSYVDFTDVVKRPVKIDKTLRSVRIIRHGKRGKLEIGAALETHGGITCLIPSESDMMLMQVEGALAGENLRVRGTVIGTLGGERCVLVDSLSFPDQERMSPYPDVWLVTVTWPSPEPRTLRIWDFGQRDLTVPCLHARGRSEKLRIVLRQYREVEVERPVKPTDGD